MIEALLSVLREWVVAAISREVATRTVRRVSEAVALFVIMAVLGLASLVFFYLFAYRWLAATIDDESAAAILCGANLLLIALIIGIRALAGSLRRKTADNAKNAELHELLNLGLSINEQLREKAPIAALVAIVAGIAVGARPELLDILKPKPKKRD